MQSLESSPTQRLAVVAGATGGIGSALCERLANQGWTLALLGRNPEKLEKLRARLPGAHSFLGGRMATRRYGSDDKVSRADIGAQFSFVRSEAWRTILESAPDVRRLEATPRVSYPRFAHPKGINHLIRTLLPENRSDPRANREIVFGDRVESISQVSAPVSKWRVSTSSGKVYDSRALLLTAPLPQSLALLDASGFAEDKSYSMLRSVEYSSCIAVTARLSENPGLAAPGFLEMPDDSLSGIFDQRAKGLHTHDPTVVVHAGPKLSRELWNKPREVSAAEIWQLATQHLSLSQRPLELSVHAWKYCRPERVLEMPYFSAACGESGLPLRICGDAFIRRAIDGAFESALAAALDLVGDLK